MNVNRGKVSGFMVFELQDGFGTGVDHASGG